MKTTLKVAELASFVYAFLLFGSYCINATYYAAFGIDIAAYMSFSEILLLFLSQPILYVPIVASIFILLFSGISAERSLSINRVYEYLGIRNDRSMLIIMFSLFVLVKVWYGIPLLTIFSTVIFVYFLICLIIPSIYNTFLLSFGPFVSSLFASKRQLSISVRNFFRRVRVCIKRKKFGKTKWRFSSVSTKNPKLVNSFYRDFISYYRFSPREVRRLRWMFNNSILFYFVLIYGFSIIVMGIANFQLGKQIQSGSMNPSKQIIVCSSDNIYSNELESAVLIGESAKYIYFYERNSFKALIVPKDRIELIKVVQKYPSMETMKLRVKNSVRGIIYP